MNGQFPIPTASVAMIMSETIYKGIVHIDHAVQFSLGMITAKK
ncbi:hypothetical protein [uncultured Sulfitobacter sp.]|nr:hypothetical protein [uncultured Sulfitobacter sp.]